MEEIEHELDKMRGYLMKSTTYCLQNERMEVKRLEEKNGEDNDNFNHN